jgi:hypothetical protein
VSAPNARAWRAACPNCGAPVEFRSAASASAVCTFCRSTLVREGEALRRIGQSAELFDDFTPLQIGASGRFQGEAFMLVGRLQLGTEEGPWNEWHAVFDSGRDGWLSEDNGRYVFAFDAPAPPDAPLLAMLRPGAPVTAAGRPWSVGSVVQAKLLAAEGELLQPPQPGRSFLVADLRSTAGEVATLDESVPGTPHWSIGRSVALAELKMSGLREASEKTLAARSAQCPSCGAPLTITLATTQSIVCGNCKSVVDLSQGIGPDMAHYAQEQAREPGIPLGRSGPLSAAPGEPPLAWQVVGYVERIEVASESGGDGSEGWREYLLWNRNEGFAFLVDTNEGWSFVRTLTGTPTVRGERAIWMDATYQRRWAYASRVAYVLGEFYWKVEANQLTQHQDFAAVAQGRQLQLSREETPTEVTWSAGSEIDAAVVATAFGLDKPQAAQLERAGPPAIGSVMSPRLIIWGIVLLVLVVLLLSMCSHDECSAEKNAFGSNSAEYRACRARAAAGSGYYGGSGGSYGGYSSGGGGHK